MQIASPVARCFEFFTLLAALSSCRFPGTVLWLNFNFYTIGAKKHPKRNTVVSMFCIFVLWGEALIHWTDSMSIINFWPGQWLQVAECLQRNLGSSLN